MRDLSVCEVPQLIIAGRIARRAMRDGARGTVRAVFDRSFYVVLDAQWICIGPRALGRGPLNALWSGSGAVRLPARDAPASIVADTLAVAGRPFAQIALGPEPPAVVRRPWTASTLARGLRDFDEAAESLRPEQGLSPLLYGGLAASSVAVAARAPVAHLHDLVLARSRDGLAPHPDQAKLLPLLGLGPGLTPSGDDLLGGALVALAALGFVDLRDAIWSSLAGKAPVLTNEIALAHLSAAAQGECAAALEDAIHALVSGGSDELVPALEAVATVGHTSGWDALVGVVVVLRAFQAGQVSAAAA